MKRENDMNRNDYGNILEERFEDGVAIGVEIGREEGREEGCEVGIELGCEKVAINMIEAKMPVEQIAQLTGLSMEHIEGLKRQ